MLVLESRSLDPHAGALLKTSHVAVTTGTSRTPFSKLLKCRENGGNQSPVNSGFALLSLLPISRQTITGPNTITVL